MASTRYGRIYHDTFHSINVKFVSGDSRQAFEEEFNAYHDSHDHDGKTPWFRDIVASDTKGYGGGAVPKEREALSIDGYTASQIEEYHEENWLHSSAWYNVPTCCVAPIISIDREFVDAGTLERHELSAIFGDMPDDDYKTLLESVQKDSFIDNTLKLLDGKILDGWHRYRVGQELNLLRKLKFQQWDEKDEGDPAAFVLARNIERRHFTPQQRAQVVVSFNERFGKGNIKAQRENSGSPNGEPKTREELAQEAGVGTRTIDRAVAVEKAGKSDKVISGEESAGDVLKAEKEKELAEKRQHALDAEHQMWKALDEVAPDWDLDDFIAAACDKNSLWGVTEFPETEETDMPDVWKARFDLLRKEIELPATWIQELLDKMAEPEQVEEQETEQPSQTAEEREAAKLLKRKKQVVKSLWDTRIQAARDYTGDADSDLNMHLTLPELEEGFKANNPSYAVGFASAMERTSETSYQIMLDNILESDVEFEVLETERRSLTTYAGDLRQWHRPDWSPDTNWILPLIEAKKAKASKDSKSTEEKLPLQKAVDEMKQSENPESNDADVTKEDLQLQGAVNNSETRLSWMWDSFENSEIAKHLSREEFALVAAQQFKWYIENDYGSGENYLLEKDFALLKNLGSVKEANKWRKRFDTVQDALHRNETWITELIPETAAEVPSEAVDEDTSLADLNLPAFKSFLESLLHHVGQVKHPTDRDDMSIAVLDVFVEQFENVSEREQLSILIDCAHSIVSESEFM